MRRIWVTAVVVVLALVLVLPLAPARAEDFQDPNPPGSGGGGWCGAECLPYGWCYCGGSCASWCAEQTPGEVPPGCFGGWVPSCCPGGGF
jgi:hypothetical protein